MVSGLLNEENIVGRLKMFFLSLEELEVWVALRVMIVITIPDKTQF